MTDELIPPAYLSPSSISTFKQCPLRFKYGRIDKLPEPPTEATLRGNFVHDVLEQLYMLDPELRTQDNARELARHYWDEKWEVQVMPLMKTRDQVREFRWSAWWCIANLWNLENPQEVTPSGLEIEVFTALDGVMVRGFIDRYSSEDGKLVISDYKTGKKPLPKYATDKFAQLLIYAAAASAQGLGDTSRVELLFLKESARLQMTVTDDDISQTITSIKKVRTAIDERCASGTFEPVRTRLCDWCNFKSICPAWKGK